jgi:hypothetical protein
LNEFNKEALGQGLRFYDAHNRFDDAVVIDGKVSEAEKALRVDADSRWIALVGPRGASINRLVLPKSWTFATSRLAHAEDERLIEPPESEAGTIGVGYNIDGVINIPRGRHTIEVQFYFPAHFQVGDEQRILDIIDHPLTVHVSAVPE